MSSPLLNLVKSSKSGWKECSHPRSNQLDVWSNSCANWGLKMRSWSPGSLRKVRFIRGLAICSWLILLITGVRNLSALVNTSSIRRVRICDFSLFSYLCLNMCRRKLLATSLSCSKEFQAIGRQRVIVMNMPSARSKSSALLSRNASGLSRISLTITLSHSSILSLPASSHSCQKRNSKSTSRKVSFIWSDFYLASNCKEWNRPFCRRWAQAW